MFKQVHTRIYVGDHKSLANIHTASITALVNLSGQTFKGDIPCIDYVLSSQELLPSEVPKIVNKLKNIAAEINTLYTSNHTILIYCDTGQNKCMLVAGFFLVTKLNLDAGTLIPLMETLYFTPEQIAEDNRDKLLMESLAEVDVIVTPGDEQQIIDRSREATRAIRGLTNASFSKLLRICDRLAK
jgi:hypothetical protein